MNFADFRRRVCGAYLGDIDDCSNERVEDVQKIAKAQQSTRQALLRLNSAAADRNRELFNEVLDR